MTGVSGYNLLKEGDVYNAPGYTHYITSSGLGNLCNDRTEEVAYTIQAGGVSSIEVCYGEYFDISCVKYYANPLNTNDIEILYGRDSADISVPLTSSGTYAFGTINSPVGYIRITHSGSVSTDIFEFFVEGTENDKVWFGEANETNLFLKNSPIGYLSSTPLEIPIYNDGSYPSDVMVAIAPTSSGVDNYLYLSTSASGTYYGINDYGIKQPSFKLLTISNDSFAISNISSLYNNWDLVLTNEAYFEARNDYVRLHVEGGQVEDERITFGHNSSLVSSLCSRDSFSSSQSFTISLEVRFIDASFESMDRGAAYYSANKFLFGFTNSFPIREHFLADYYYDYPTGDRPGGSFAAIWLGAQHDVGSTDKDICVGGAVCNQDFNEKNSYTDFQEMRGVGNDHPLLNAVPLEHISENIFCESSYTDGSIDAPWRLLTVSYNHTERKARFFLDRILVNEYVFEDKSFSEACRVFFGFVGAGSAIVDFRNFIVRNDYVADLYCEQSTAWASSNMDFTHSPDKMIDGDYGDFTSFWASRENPSLGVGINVDFSSAYDVGAVRIRKPGLSDYVTISGVSTLIGKSVRRMDFHFSNGETRYVEFDNDNDTYFGGWDIKYLVTSSGTTQPVVGVTSVSGVLDSVYTRPSGNNRLVLEEVEFFTVSGADVLSSSSSENNSYFWFDGYSRNISTNGEYNSLSIRNQEVYDVACCEDCEKLVYLADYGASNPVFYDYVDNDQRYSYAETLYKRDGRGTGIKVGCCMESGEEAWFWRYFGEVASIKAVYVDLQSNVGEGYYFYGKPDKWKVQYLVAGGNPNEADDWLDAPVITSIYPSGNYGTYTQYLVSNNDGEYYTDFINAFDLTGDVILPDDLFCRLNFYNKPVYLYGAGKPVSSIYVELDSSIRTQGIKFVIADGYLDVDKHNKATGYSIMSFMCYSECPVGSYVSPVFDTSTKQNTERIFVDRENNDGSVSVLYRSSNVPPVYKNDTAYEYWEDLGQRYAGISSSITTQPLSGGASVVPVDNYLYFLGSTSAAEKTVIYDTISGKWSFGGNVAVDVDGNKILPDGRTGNNLVRVGNKLVCATANRNGSGLYNYGLAKYYLTENDYGYQGWQTYPYQRPMDAVDATMVSDGTSRVYFLSKNGTITVFDTETGILDTEGRTDMPMHGLSYREHAVPVYHDGNIYVCGGGYLYGAVPSFDVYNVASDTWSSGPDMPYSISHSWALYVDGFIYVLPTYGAVGGIYAPYMKYDLSGGFWSVVTSLCYNRASFFLDTWNTPVSISPVPNAYCLCSDYLYAIDWLRNDFRRAKLVLDGWESGCLPSRDDVSWYNSGGMEWNEVLSGSEFMPQDRYIQYKIQLEVTGEDSPEVNEAVIVMPQVLESVPPGSSKSVYLKTNVVEGNTNILNRAKLKLYD